MKLFIKLTPTKDEVVCLVRASDEHKIVCIPNIEFTISELFPKRKQVGTKTVIPKETPLTFINLKLKNEGYIVISCCLEETLIYSEWRELVKIYSIQSVVFRKKYMNEDPKDGYYYILDDIDYADLEPQDLTCSYFHLETMPYFNTAYNALRRVQKDCTCHGLPLPITNELSLKILLDFTFGKINDDFILEADYEIWKERLRLCRFNSFNDYGTVASHFSYAFIDSPNVFDIMPYFSCALPPIEILVEVEKYLKLI